MRTEKILSSMLHARNTNPSIFANRKAMANGKEYILLSRSVEVQYQGQFGLLIFSDQSPLGKSNDARKVFRQEILPKDICWLYFKNKSGACTWLGKITSDQKNNSAVALVLIDVEYNKEKKTLSLVIPESLSKSLPF